MRLMRSELGIARALAGALMRTRRATAADRSTRRLVVHADMVPVGLVGVVVMLLVDAAVHIVMPGMGHMPVVFLFHATSSLVPRGSAFVDNRIGVFPGCQLVMEPCFFHRSHSSQSTTSIAA